MNFNYRDTSLAGQPVQCPAQRSQASLFEDKYDSRDPPCFVASPIQMTCLHISTTCPFGTNV